MKTRKVATQQLHNQPPHRRPYQPRQAPRGPLDPIRSQQSRSRLRLGRLQAAKAPKIVPWNPTPDYDKQRKVRQTYNYTPIEAPVPITRDIHLQRKQRNTDSREFLRGRSNHYINSGNNSYSLSQPKNNMYGRDRSVDEHSENSLNKRQGIQVTKTLLKKISGMYSDKDFRDRSFKGEETTGMSLTHLTGKVQDQYQLSDFQMQGGPSRPVTGNSYTQRVSFTGAPPQLNYYPVYGQIQKNNHQMQGRPSSNRSGSENDRQRSRLRKLVAQMPAQPLHANFNQRPAPSPSKPRVSFTTSSPQQQQLPRVQSYDLLHSNRPLSQSFQMGSELMAQPPWRDSVNQRDWQQTSQQFIIASKNKTLEQLSVKQSMVLGFDNYYQ